MLIHLSRAFAQLPDRPFRRVVAVSLVGSVLLFAALLTGIGYLLTHTALFQVGWLDTVVDVLGGLGALVLTWILFPAAIIALSGLMLDSVAAAVDRRYYPRLPPGREQTVLEGVLSSLKFLALVVLLNLAILPFLLLGPLYPIIYYTVNGYLVGREYYELVSYRRVDKDAARYLRSSNSLRLFVAGVTIVFLSTIPFVNLLAPVVATAFMVHLFEQLRRDLPPPRAA